MQSLGSHPKKIPKRVIVAGAINVDYFYHVPTLEPLRLLPWWPRLGEREISRQQRLELDQFVASSPDISSVHICGGGQAANFAVALAECDAHVMLVATVGNDAAAETALSDLKRVDLSLVRRSDATAEAFIFIDPLGERDIFIFAPCKQLPEQVDDVANVDAELVHFTSLATKEQLQIQQRINRLISASALRSLDIGALYAAMGHHNLAPLLLGLDVLFATNNEAENFANLPMPAAATEVFAYGVKSVCCKLGAAGACLYRSDGTVVESVAPSVSVVDSTGAGDVFAAVFMGAILTGVSQSVALGAATRLASNSVRAWGRAAYPNNEEFRHAIKAEQNMAVP